MNFWTQLVTLLIAAAASSALAAQGPLLLLKTVIPLPDVEGRIDHLAFDAARNRLFVAALGNNSVEVIDTASGVHLKTLPGFHEPQGVAVVPDFGVVAVANGDTGTLQLIDGETYQTKHVIAIGGDADNVRYDVAARQLYVAYEGGLAVIDPGAGSVVRRLSIPGHPESFQLERGGSRVFANLPGAAQVVVADRQTSAVTSRWPAVSSRANYPMALDEPTERLFVGCRQPATVVVYETRTGKVMATIASVGDTDDLFYDAVRKRLYVIGGEGYVDVIQRESAEGFKRSARVPTSSGARTGLYVPEQSRLYVAIPHRGNQRAEIRVYEAQN
jgi:DNA-binding beta-propeller fold protein YncE